MDAREIDGTPTDASNVGESATGERSDDDVDNATTSEQSRFSAPLNHLHQGDSSGNKLRTKGEDAESDEDIISGDYAAGASNVESREQASNATHDYKNTSNTSTTSFTSSGSSSKQQQQPPKSKSKDPREVDFTTSYARKAEQGERQMEANRVRARDIRKRKKTMVEEMQRKIVGLTMANQHLIRQTQMQNAEIHLLRSTQGLIPNHSVSIAC